MSLLELIGLDYLLNGNTTTTAESGIGIGSIFYVIGFVLWLVLIVFGGTLVDQAATVFNLLVAVFFLLGLIVRTIKECVIKEKSKAKIIFNIISVIIALGAFLYGMSNTYHALIFDFEYTKYASGIATTLLPVLITNVIYILVFSENKFFGRIKNTFSLALGVIGAFLFIFVIGQFVNVVVWLSGNTDIYNNFSYYHKISIAENREDWGCDSVKEYIYENFPRVAKEVVDAYKNSEIYQHNLTYGGEEFAEKQLKIWLRQNNPYNEELKKYGLSYAGRKWESNTVVTYIIRDEEWAKLMYIKFDYSTYTILGELTEEEYQEIVAVPNVE